MIRRPHILSSRQSPDKKLELLLVFSGQMHKLKPHAYRVVGSFHQRTTADGRIMHPQHK